MESGLVPTKLLRGYTVAAIYERIRNPFYRGSFMWQGELYKGKHELFIPQALIKRVDETLGAKGKSVRLAPDENTSLVGGWLKCSCGCHIVYEHKKKINRKTKETRGYHYYHCTNGKKVHESLRGLNVNGVKIWEQLGQAIDDISISEDFAQEIADALNKIESKAYSTIKKQISEWELQEKLLQDREDILLNKLLDNQIDQQVFDTHLRRIRTERGLITKRIEELQLGLNSAVIETCKSVLELAKDSKSLWNEQPAIERKKVLDHILSNPVLNGVNVEYTLRRPFAILKEMKGDAEWCARQDSNIFQIYK